jgi:hypothetical protein
MTDIWVCASCNSINRQRDTRCYKCGSKQDEATRQGAIVDLRTERAAQERAVTRYQGSLIRALLAAGFIVAVAVLGVVVLNESLGAIRYLRDQIPDILQTGVIDEAELSRRAAGAVVPEQAQLVAAIGALLFFATWLSRVVANIPALGGGTPSRTPTQAFVYPLIPVWNLFKVPPIIQDALYRLDAKAGGFFMVLVAWVGLVGSWIISFVVGWWVNLRVMSVTVNAETLGEAIDDVRQAYDILVIVEIVTTLLVSAGALVLVVIMFRIESRARARDREIRAALTSRSADGHVAPPPAAVVEAPVAATTPVMGSTTPPGTAVSATSLGASPIGSGPRLDVGVGSTGITVSVAGSAPERSSTEELREAATALLDAGGTVIVTANDAGDDTAATVESIVRIFRAAGVPTTERQA